VLNKLGELACSRVFTSHFTPAMMKNHPPLPLIFMFARGKMESENKTHSNRKTGRACCLGAGQSSYKMHERNFFDLTKDKLFIIHQKKKKNKTKQNKKQKKKEKHVFL